MVIILGLVVLMLLFRIGFHVTGAILSMMIWVVIRLPLALLMFCFGLMLCVTILLIPLGIKLMGFAWKILF